MPPMPASASFATPGFCRGICLSLSCAMLMAANLPGQSKAPPPVIDSRPKYAVLFVSGYELDKGLADSFLQSHDASHNAAEAMRKLEELAQHHQAARVSCAAMPLTSGMMSRLDTGTAVIQGMGIISPLGDILTTTMTRTAKAGGVTSRIRANLDAKGGTPVFIGSVPDVKPGRDQLLFVRCVTHIVE